MPLGNLGWTGVICTLVIATFGQWGCALLVVVFMVLVGTSVSTVYMVGRDWLEDYWNKACFSRIVLPNNGISKVKKSVLNKPPALKLDKRITGSSLIDEPLQEVLQFTLRDYVHIWYRSISDDDRFLLTLQESVQKAFITFCTRMKEADWVHFLTIQLVEDVATHLRLFRQAQQKLHEIKRLDPKTNPNLITIFFELDKDSEKEIPLSGVCCSAEEEISYIRDLTEVLLFLLLDSEDFKGRPYRFLARELVVNALLLPTISLFSDPDYINQTIIWLCREVPITSEGFITILRTTNNADELTAVMEKVNHEIAVQRSKDSGGDDDIIIKQQLSSLLFVKRVVDHRLQRLQEGVDTDSAGLPTRIDWKKIMLPGYKLCCLPLDDILKHNVALSYFIDFMTSLSQQAYMFFYLTVEAYRVSAEQHIAKAYTEHPHNPDADLASLQEVAYNIYKQYLAPEAEPRIKLDDATMKRLYRRIHTEKPSEEWFDEAQNKVLEMLAEDRFLGAFRRSTQYIKMLAELDLLKDTSRSDDDDIQSLDDQPTNSDTISMSSQEDAISESSSTSARNVVQTSGSAAEIKIAIVSSGVVRESLKPYVMYALDVTKISTEFGEEKWQIYRRYSDFYDFHMIVQRKFGNVANHVFPGKKTFNNLNSDFLDKRMHQLNDYLQYLLRPQVIEKFPGLFDVTLHFLEPMIYKSRSQFAQKMDHVVNPLKESIRTVTHAVKLMPDNFVQTMDGMMDGLTKLLYNKPNPDLHALTFQDKGCAIGLDLETEEDIPLRILLILVDEVFDLKSRNQWLRRRIVVLLRQFIKSVYGDRINRKIIDYVELMTTAEQITEYVKAFRQTIWPNGILASPSPSRDEGAKMRARVSAKMSMLCSLPDDMKHIIGSETTRKGVYLVFEMLQQQTLNRRLVYVILDGILKLLFPEVSIPSILRQLHPNSSRSYIR